MYEYNTLITVHQRSWYIMLASSSRHSNTEVIEILKKHLPLLYKDSYEGIPAFPAKINSTKR